MFDLEDCRIVNNFASLCAGHEFINVTGPLAGHAVTSESTLTLYDISETLVTALDLCLNCVLLHLLCVLGILGNTLNVLILSRHDNKTTTNMMLISLSVSDLLFSVTQSVSRMWSLVAKFDTVTASTLQAMYMVYVRTWNEMTLLVSIYQVTIIALVRLMAVCSPLKVRHSVTPTRIRCVILSTYILLAVLTSPIHMMYEIHWVKVSDNVTMATYQPTSLYSAHRESFSFYLTAILSHVKSSVPLTTVSVCSVIILLRLSMSPKHLDKQHKSSIKRAKTIKAAKMLLTMCSLLMIFVLLPTATFEGFISFSPDKTQLSCRFKVVIAYISSILFQLSSSSNFIVYVTMNSKFALTYKELFCRF